MPLARDKRGNGFKSLFSSMAGITRQKAYHQEQVSTRDRTQEFTFIKS